MLWVLWYTLQNNLAEVKGLKNILAEEEVLVKIRYVLFFAKIFYMMASVCCHDNYAVAR